MRIVLLFSPVLVLGTLKCLSHIFTLNSYNSERIIYVYTQRDKHISDITNEETEA